MSDATRPPDAAEPPGKPTNSSVGHPRRRRRRRRVAIAALASVLALAGAALLVGYESINHLADSIPRVRVAHLAAASKPNGGPSFGGQNVLITGSPWGPTGVPTQPPSPPSSSGLIMILHINSNQQAGGVVSIPPQAVVSIPGHGRQPLWNASKIGGPSLLVQTVEGLTHVMINHYARIDFNHVSNVVNTIGGVDVTLPAPATSFGHTFHAGVNHLTGLTALYYARATDRDEAGKVLRQQSLIRAIMKKIADDHLLTNPVSAVRVTRALVSMLTVDSNFTTGGLLALAKELAGLSSSAGTFVTAPSHTVGALVFLDPVVSRQLWAAIRQDAIAAFAKKYPATVTPEAVP